MKVGDLVKVEYPTDKFYNGESYFGVVLETKDNGSFDKIWCMQTNSIHILSRWRDIIEVISKSK